MKESPLLACMMRGGLWSAAGSCGAQLMTFVAFALAARVLAPSIYGEVGFVQNTITALSLLVAPSLGVAATRVVAHTLPSDRVRAGFFVGTIEIAALMLSLSAAALWTIAGDGFSARFESIAPLNVHSVLFAMAAAASILGAVQTALLAGLDAFRGIATLNLCKGIAALLSVPFLSSLGGAGGAVAAIACVNLVGILLGHCLLRRTLRERGTRWQATSFAILVPLFGRYSAPTVLSSLTVLPVMWMPNVLLINGPHGLFELGIFNAANQVRQGLAVLISLFTLPFLPMFTNLLATGDIKGFRKSVKIAAAVVSVLSLTGGVVACLYSEQIMAFFGGEYARGTSTLVMLIGSVFMANISSVFGIALQALDRMWHAFWINLTWSLAFIACAVMLSRHGAFGIGAAFTISYTVHLLVLVAASVLLLRSIELHDGRVLSRPVLEGGIP